MTTDELMALALHMVGESADEDERTFDIAKAALRSALEQVVADAERYEWLRRNCTNLAVNVELNGNGAEITETIDEAIDKARKATNANT